MFGDTLCFICLTACVLFSTPALSIFNICCLQYPAAGAAVAPPQMVMHGSKMPPGYVPPAGYNMAQPYYVGVSCLPI